MGKITRRERLISYIILLISAFFFMYFFALWESPFYEYWYGCDASFFSMAGRGITKGWVPYVDFFDLKGPYFFFIEALSQLIHTDRLGVFIIEIPFTYASFILIYEICRLFISKLKAIAVMVITIFFYIGTLWGGNTLEEFMLPLSLLVLFLSLKYVIMPMCITDGDSCVSEASLANDTVDDIIPRTNLLCETVAPLVTGICFGIILFSKVTVGAPIAGIVIAISLTYLIRKDYKSLFKYLGFSLLGVIVSITPVIIYFAIKGALSDMLYAVFIFAFKRSVDFSESFNIDWELKAIGCYFSFFFAIFHIKKIKQPLWITIISMSAVTYLLMHLGVPFIYYFTTVFPVFVLSFVILLELYNPLVLFSNIRQFICLALLAVMMYYYAHVSLDTIRTMINRDTNPWYESDYQAAIDLAKLIPEYERDQVFSFSIDMTWFEANQMLPCYKYPINLQFFINLDPAIADDLTEYLTETPPKWLIVGDSFRDEIPFLFKIVDNEYDCICSNDSGNLYMLK